MNLEHLASFSPFRRPARSQNHAVAAVVLASVVRLAAGQEAEVAQPEFAGEVEEVIVMGIRGALRQSIDVKRDSDGVVDAITEEDIGKFPDKNVAESLQRITGVTIQRQFGEGQGVAIRGASQNMTLTTLNGQNVASTGWFAFEPARRSFNYALLPSELVGNIKIHKSSQADLVEGGIGGTVVINTRKPLDMGNASVYGAAQGAYTSDSGHVDPQLSGLASWKNEGGNAGFLVSGVYQARQLQRMGTEAFWPWGAGPVGFEQDRERSAVNAIGQFDATEKLTLTVTWLDMQMRADNTNYALWLTKGDNDTRARNGTPVAGALGVAFFQARPREATMVAAVYDLKAEYTGDRWFAEFQVGRTDSSGGTDFEMVVNDARTPSIGASTYDFSNGAHTWRLREVDFESYDPGTLAMGTGLLFNKTPKTDDESYLQADVEFDLYRTPIASLKTGVRFADHQTSSRLLAFTQAPGFDPTLPTARVADGRVEVGLDGRQILALDVDAVRDWAKASITGEAEDRVSFSQIDEENGSAYVMVTFEGDRWRGNAGVRYVQTDAGSNYYLDGRRAESSASYAEWLPSVNWAFEPTPEVTVRAAAARAMTRPRYVDMYVNPNITGANDEHPDNQFWIVGNVGLLPYLATQFDASIEYYFDEGSFASATVFRKSVGNFVGRREYAAPSAAIPYRLAGDEAANGWTVQELVNGDSGTIQGVEVQYQLEHSSGLGTVINYTLTDSEADDPAVFPDGQAMLSDASRHSANLTLYYESYRFRIRGSYNYRSEYMLREVGAYGNRLHDDFGTIDMSASWHFTDSLSVNFDAQNLLQQNATQSGNNAGFTPNSGFSTGFPLYEYQTAMRLMLGISYKR